MSIRQYLIRFYKQTRSDECATYTCNEFTSRPSTDCLFYSFERARACPPSVLFTLIRETIMNSMVSDNNGEIGNVKQKEALAYRQ